MGNGLDEEPRGHPEGVRVMEQPIEAEDVSVIRSHRWIMVRADIASWPFGPVEILIDGHRYRFRLAGRGNVGARAAVRLVELEGIEQLEGLDAALARLPARTAALIRTLEDG